MIIIIILIIILILDVRSKEGFDSGIFRDVEFRSADDPKICIHKLGSDTDFNIEKKLHWWKELNHKNSKHILEYSTGTKLFNVYRIDSINNNTFRWNINNYKDGCCKKTNVGFYPSKVPADNEWFKFKWVDNETCIIQTKCGGYVGGEIAHDKDIFAGSDVPAAKIKLYSYTLNRFLKASDFGETVSNTINKSIKSLLESTKTTTASNSSKTKKFNLKYGAYYLIPKFINGNIYLECTSSSPPVQQFSIDSNNNLITEPIGNLGIRQIAPIKNINPNVNTGEGTITLAKELCGDGRYCSGPFKRDKKVDSARVKSIYMKPGDMPVYKCNTSNNVNYVPITELKLDKYINGNNITNNNSSPLPQFNLTCDDKYLHPALLNGKLIFNVTSSRPSKPQFTIDKNKDNIFVNNISELGEFANYPIGKIKGRATQNNQLTKVVLENYLYGDGRYCSGCNNRSSLERLSKIFINPNDITTYTCCKRPNKSYISINQLRVVDYEN